MVTKPVATLIGRIGIAAALVLSLMSAVAEADVVAVVSVRSPITALSPTQVADLFFGKASRFPNGLQAFPVDQAEGSAVRDEFYSKIVGKTAAQVKAYWSKIIFTGRGQPPRAVLTDLDVKKIVSLNTAAIGYIDAAQLDDSVRAL